MREDWNTLRFRQAWLGRPRATTAHDGRSDRQVATQMVLVVGWITDDGRQIDAHTDQPACHPRPRRHHGHAWRRDAVAAEEGSTCQAAGLRIPLDAPAQSLCSAAVDIARLL